MGTDHKLISDWNSYAVQTGLSKTEILGMAYLSTAVPTVLSAVRRDETISERLEKVVTDLNQSSAGGEFVLNIYREFYFNALSKCNKISRLNMEGLPEDFYLDEHNSYMKYNYSDTSQSGGSAESSFFLISGAAVELAKNTGKILLDHNADTRQAFNLGHLHANYLLSLNYIAANNAILYSNILPAYASSLIQAISDPDDISLRADVWMFSKVLRHILQKSKYDSEFRSWIWDYHNLLFYEDKSGAGEVKKEWDLTDEYFEIKMLIKVYKSLYSYYRSNKHTGDQFINKSAGTVKTWEEYLDCIRDKLKTEYSITLKTGEFINAGERANYYCLIFLKSVEIYLEKFSLSLI